jgi:DNA-binding response OmpR family regulator
MDRGRILIFGQTKENSYEIRNLLDNKRFELEIVLSGTVGRQILSTRLMNLLVVHTEAIDDEGREFLSYLEEQEIPIPVMILGEEAAKFRESVGEERQVACFEKPYAVEQVLDYIRSL